MFLFELEADPLAIQIVGIVNQLKAEMEMGQRPTLMSEQELIDTLRTNEIYVNPKQLQGMLNSAPLKNLVKIDNHRVKFIGNEEPDELPDMDPEKKAKADKKIVSSMAKKAMKSTDNLPLPDISSKLENPPVKPPPLPK